ncbi:MAG TPA: hypothetical protein GXX51_11010 [Firmicutes bacterium]|nr:hypothetical protein [Bacillota bacterium]
MKLQLSSLIHGIQRSIVRKFCGIKAGCPGRASRTAAPRSTISMVKPEVIDHAPSNMDEISVHLNGLEIFMQRWYTYDVPHEVSVFIPKAEVRTRRNRGTEETEIILNSITVVHAPRFPPRR